MGKRAIRVLGKFLILAVAAVTAGVLLGYLAGAASAGVSGHVYYTPKGATAVAGYEASALGDYFTHQYAYTGSNGATLGQLDATAPNADGSLGNTAAFPLAAHVDNGVGIGLCDQNTGDAAQLGIVNIGGGLKDVVWATGVFHSPAADGTDICHNGVVSTFVNAGPYTAASTTGILIAGVPIQNTVTVDILSDQHHAHNGCAAGTILFSAVNLGDPAAVHNSPCITAPGGTATVFNEADQGSVADNTAVAPLTGTVPLPDGVTNSLAVFAHDTLSANTPHGTAHGSFQADPAWNVFAVASTNNGLAPPAGSLLLAPSVFRNDHDTLLIGGAVA